MGKLLNTAIAGSKTNVLTSQLTLFSELGTAINSRAQWYKNGTLVGTFTSETIVTLNSTDTFYIVGVKNSAPTGCNWNILKNSVSQESGASNAFTSATYTAGSGNVWDVSVLLGL